MKISYSTLLTKVYKQLKRTWDSFAKCWSECFEADRMLHETLWIILNVKPHWKDTKWNTNLVFQKVSSDESTLQKYTIKSVETLIKQPCIFFLAHLFLFSNASVFQRQILTAIWWWIDKYYYESDIIVAVSAFLFRDTQLCPHVLRTHTHTHTQCILLCELWGGLFLFIRAGEDQRSAAQRLRGELAEAAACGGVWRRRHDPDRQEETSCAAAAGPGWEACARKLIQQYIAIFIFVNYCIVSWPMYRDAYRIVKSLPNPALKGALSQITILCSATRWGWLCSVSGVNILHSMPFRRRGWAPGWHVS